MNTGPVEVIADPMLIASPDCGAGICRRRIDYDGTRSGTSTVINPILAPTCPFLVGALNVVSQWSGVPDIDRTIKLLHISLRYESWQSPTGSGIRVKVFGKAADVVVFRSAGLIWQIKKGLRGGEVARDKSYPLIRVLPRTCALVKIFAWTIERSWNYSVADPFPWPFVTSWLGEVVTIEASLRAGCRIYAVSIHKFDPLPMRKAMVFRIEVPTLIKDGLKTLVIDHRVHAVAIGKRKIKKLKLNRYFLLLTIGNDGD